MENNEAQNSEATTDQLEVRKLLTINKIVKSISDEKPLNESLLQVCHILPEGYIYPDYVNVRISYGEKQVTTKNFKETRWVEHQQISLPDQTDGLVEVFYTHEYLEHANNDYLNKNSEYIENIAQLISGLIARNQLEILLHENRERIKELTGIHRTTEILKKGKTLEESLHEICRFLPEAWQYPEYTAAKITLEDKVFRSFPFKETSWVQVQTFETADSRKGSIEIYYLKEFPEADEGPFLEEERRLLDDLAALISETVSKNSMHRLFRDNMERLKELRGINQTSAILKNSKNIEEALQEICTILPEAWQYPEHTAVRITYGKKIFTSGNFWETNWFQKEKFNAPGNKKGLIEIFYLKAFPEADEGPFLKEERHLLINLANLISGSATRNVFKELRDANTERLKELKAINKTSAIIAKGKSVDETLQDIVEILPGSWQYPKFTVARIFFEEKYYTSPGFKKTRWIQSENFTTIDSKKGTVEICYLKQFRDIDEGPFLKEERHLLINITKLITGYLNNYKGREIMQSKTAGNKIDAHKSYEFRKSFIQNKRPLQLFFNQQIIDKYIYLDMMKYKVKEILFVATLYDAFILENEDNFFEQFMGEIYQYSLFSLPRITGVTSEEEAMEIMQTKSFDLVILMIGIDRKTPIDISKKIKNTQPNLPIYVLLSNKSCIKQFEELVPTTASLDKLFVWQGNSQIFFSIVKSIEDNANVENDTKIGLVRIILLIEDAADYYSRYLQALYSIVFEQIQNILPEVEKNELDKISKMRSRPKILHARNYEEAMYIFNKYKDFMLCVISDVEFEHEGLLDKSAGIKFIKYAKSQINNLPVILQSSNDKYIKAAGEMNISYINKNSKTLHQDLKTFLTDYIYFGDFIFRDSKGNQIARAKSLREFETLLYQVPAESLTLHARENQFSLWLMARGEIELARQANPVKVSDFNTVEEFRAFFIQQIRQHKEEKKRGKVLNFDETSILDEKNIISFSGGSFGGKGRGVAFINALINNLDFSFISDKINIRSPLTAIIGIDEFEEFLENNHLESIIFNSKLSYPDIKNLFVRGELSKALMQKLEVFLEQVEKPIAIRSSSLSEDSITQPFAGVFDTYIIPNNHPDKQTRLKMLANAIKLVYASIYSDDAKTFFTAIGHKNEEERMAIILQELIGNQYDHYYYPHISGTAQSYNYYPVSQMKPEDGFANIAIGHGFYVVGGRKSYRFSPKNPEIEVFSTKDLLNSTQVELLALDLSKKNIDLMNDGELAAFDYIDLSVAEKHGSIKHCVSTYNADNDRIEPGLLKSGPRIVNFANILKFSQVPLAQTINVILNMIKEALGSPVEIEYAVDLNRTINHLPSFYLLQIKPLIGEQLNNEVLTSTINHEDCILYSRNSVGNGRVNTIRDLIFVDVSKFDKMKTMEMAKEIKELNEMMVNQNRQYILIGPGRWGTREKSLGIPVNWNDISNSKVIIEMSLAHYPLDASLGSHFFHNIISMNIGYFSVLNSSNTDYIKWEIIHQQPVINETKHFKHVRFDKPLEIRMNGKQRTSAIIYQ